MIGVLGKKLGMTQVFDEEGKFIPITLIEVGPSEVLAIMTKDKNGYVALKLGTGERKKKSKNKPKNRFIREIRLNDSDKPAYKTGDSIEVSVFKEGDYVDVTGVSKGKGFQGGVKRWGWRGGPKSHGSTFHRAPGSIGASSFPSRVHKGKTMPGHMGSEKKTVQNLKVIKVDNGNKLLAVRGAVPGHNNSYLVIREAKKIPIKQKTDEKDTKQKTGK